VRSKVRLTSLKLEHREKRIAFEEMLLAVRRVRERIERLEQAMREAVADWALAATSRYAAWWGSCKMERAAMADLEMMNCAKCKSKMEEGTLYSWSFVNFVIIPAGMRWGFAKKAPVRTFRCTVCGYLESYARLPPR
jgi:hypothetical protein